MLADKIKALAEGTDKLDELKELISDSDALEAQLAEAKKAIEERDSQIATLRDTNMRLFLSQTTNVNEEPEPEKTGDELIEDLFK